MLPSPPTSGRRSSAPSRTPPTCASTCGGSRRARTTSARPTTRTTPSGSSRKFKEWGLDARIETFDVLFPTPQGARGRNARALALHGEAAGAGGRARPHLRRSRPSSFPPTTPTRSTATSPAAWSTSTTACRRTTSSSSGWAFRSRARSSSRATAAPGAASSPRSRPSTARSAASSTPIRATTATSRATSSPHGPYRPPDGVQRGSVMDMPLYPGDPLTPGVGRHRQTPSACRSKEARTLTKIPVLPISYGDAQPLLAALERAGRAGGLARRAAHHLSRRAGAGQGAPEGEVELGHQAALQRDRAHPRRGVSRTSGSSAATITTPGSTAPTIPSPALAALMEEARGLAELLQAGLEAEAHHRLLRVGRRGAGAARLHRVGRGARRRTAPQGRGLHQHRRQRARLPGHGRARTRWRSSSTAWRATSRTRRRTSPVWKRLQLWRIADAPPADRQELRARADLRIGALGSGSDYTAFLDHLGIAVAQPGLRRRGRQRHLPLHLRRFLLVHALLRFRFRLRARAGADRRHGRHAAGGRGRCCPSSSAT